MPTHWADFQQVTFTRWINEHLADRGMRVEDIAKDLKDGLALINLLEIISSQNLGRHNKHPKIVIQKMENLNICITWLKNQGLKLVNIGAEDVGDGNLRIILGLLWIIILRYEVNKGDGDLLKWVQSKIPEYDIKNFTKDWNDGRAICALVDALKPGTIPNHRAMDPNDKLNNAACGINAGERVLGVEPLILADEMTHKKVDKLGMMTYIAQYRNLNPNDFKDADRCQAYGPGLVEAIQAQPTSFTVETPEDVKNAALVVTISGPGGNVPCTLSAPVKGKYEAAYTPAVMGKHTVSITFKGDHIPGSVFHLIALERESLGGEGKIRVFFSTTSGSEKGRKDFFHLTNLFEAHKVHLRSDFEPWVAVDLMEKDDRDAVFRVAGVRTLPIVMIDDRYAGDYDVMNALNEQGKLVDTLNVQAAGQLMSEEEHAARMKNASAGAGFSGEK